MKITTVIGIILLAGTVYSWIKNIRVIAKGQKEFTPTDKFLNFPLLFVWLVFCTAFSIGLMVNN